MASSITLSSAVRSNLLSLQQTADLLGRTQEKLATGLKVNSALDDATAFFTASSLNSRANDLSRLQDFVSNSIQTLKAADEGISAITQLVESAEATARQALNSAGNNASATGNVDTTATGFDTFEATATGNVDVASDGLDLTATADSSGFSTVVAGDNGKQFTIGDGTTTTADITLATGDDLSTVVGKIDAALTAAGITDVSVSENGGEIRLTSQNGADIVITEGTTTGGAAAVGLTPGTTNASNALGLEQGDTLTVNGTTLTYGTGTGEFNSVTELTDQLNAISGVSASVDGTTGFLSVTTTDGSDLVIAEGTNTPAADLGLTAGTVAASNSVGIENGDTFTVQVGSATATTITFGNGTGEVNTADELVAALDALTNVDASVTDDGYLSIEATNGEDLTVAEGVNTPLSDLGITAGSSSAAENTDRTAFAAQFDELRTQINQLAADATYNGNNLLAGDNVTVTFNEDASSTLTIQGVNFNSAGLGIDQSVNTFQTDADINAALTDLEAATSTLRAQASKFGSNLSVVEVRQDFTKNIINVLETGAANLTLADTNEEGANLLALQTRQQLSSTSLSLASQADQNVLRLF